MNDAIQIHHVSRPIAPKCVIFSLTSVICQRKMRPVSALTLISQNPFTTRFTRPDYGSLGTDDDVYLLTYQTGVRAFRHL